MEVRPVASLLAGFRGFPTHIVENYTRISTYEVEVIRNIYVDDERKHY